MLSAPAARTQSWTELALRDEVGRKGHWIGAVALYNGVEIEVILEDGTLLRGTYEWSGMTARWPGVRVKLRVRQEPENGRPIYAVLALPPQALVRFPTP